MGWFGRSCGRDSRGVSWIKICRKSILGPMALDAVGFCTIATDPTATITKVKVYGMINVR